MCTPHVLHCLLFAEMPPKIELFLLSCLDKDEIFDDDKSTKMGFLKYDGYRSGSKAR